jgi:hypothetical protein
MKNEPNLPAVAGPLDRQVRPLALCALCGADKGYTLGVGDTYRWWVVCCGACGRQVDECRSDGNTSLSAAKPLSWPAADEVWNDAGAHAEKLLADRDRAVRLLHLAMAQLRRWSEAYGTHTPPWLPPGGDVRLAEDVDEFLRPNVI